MRLLNVNGQVAVVLTKSEQKKYANVVGNVALTPSAPAERIYATKAERAAGNGFTCTCGRTDLRFAPVAGRSYHKDPSGNLHDLR